MKLPLVSICIPTYNRAAALRAGLDEVRRQAYDPLEILISDNGSTDETEAVCRAAAAADSRIRYVRHPRNRGLYGNHNYCLDESRGEYLSFFHDHDERDRHLIRTFVEFLEQHPSVGVVSSDWELIDESGAVVGVREHPVQAITPGLTYIGQTLRSGQSAIGIPGALIRRAALGTVRFDEQGPIGFGDFVVWCELAERWAVGHIPRRLWRWRQARSSQSARTIESLTRDYETNLMTYCDRHLARWPDHQGLVVRWRRAITQYLFWALVYEVGLHFRHLRNGPVRQGADRTLFEILDYRLSPEQFQRVIAQMDRYRTGPLQSGVYHVIHGLVRRNVTWPLAFAAAHHTTFRELLRLR